MTAEQLGELAAPATGIPAAGRWRRRLALTVMVLAWLYLAGVLAAWGLLREADLWWPATLLMFSPRWLLAFPAVLLLPLVLLLRRRALLPTLVALVLALGPVSGFCIPWQRLHSAPPASLRVRVLTCNMHYRRPDPDNLDRLVTEARPDIVALQEWPGWKRSRVLAESDLHVHKTDRLFLASRYPLRRVVELGEHSMTERGSVTRYELETPNGPITILSLHLASPRQELYETLHNWEKGSEDLKGNSELRWKQHGYLRDQADEVSGPLLLAGDFNTPPESAIFRALWGGYSDAFSEAGLGWGYTFYGGRTTVRIDHILAGTGWHCERCWVGPDVGSPHRPVLADLTRP